MCMCVCGEGGRPPALSMLLPLVVALDPCSPPLPRCAICRRDVCTCRDEREVVRVWKGGKVLVRTHLSFPHYVSTISFSFLAEVSVPAYYVIIVNCAPALLVRTYIHVHPPA